MTDQCHFNIKEKSNQAFSLEAQLAGSGRGGRAVGMSSPQCGLDLTYVRGTLPKTFPNLSILGLSSEELLPGLFRYIRFSQSRGRGPEWGSPLPYGDRDTQVTDGASGARWEPARSG